MSATALPTASRPPACASGENRPPFRPVILFLGVAATMALLAGQYWFESALCRRFKDRRCCPSCKWWSTWVLFAAAAVVFFRLTLRQISPMYHAPVFITVILIGAHFYYGVLENFTPTWLGALTGGWITSYSPTFVTILAAIGAEFLFGRFAYGKWPNPVSAYITGISAGILIKSPELWPFVLCAVVSIASKYALRVRGRHLWNPTNFGVTVLLLLPRCTRPASAFSTATSSGPTSSSGRSGH